jgi:chorismate mutase/prephenate dehydratase
MGKNEDRAVTKAASLEKLRARIDQLDREILRLMNERAKLAAEVGNLKNEHGLAVYSPGREESVIQNVLQHNPGPLSETCVRAIFRELISGSRALERTLRVAYLGPEYSFSHIAARERFGASVEYVGVGSIQAVFEEVADRHADYGVVPLENSTDGRISDTLDMFVRLPVRICAEIRLRIHHYLLARCSQNEIRRVYSRPQALSQCRRWLAQHVPLAQLIEVASTATAAQLAQAEPNAAAVASRQAAIHYQLNIVAERIEDVENNVTRFAVLGELREKKTGQDRTTVLFQVPHKPGSLADALMVFKRNRINLTWIESFPLRGSDQEYVFFADLLGHESETRVKRALTSLQKKATMVRVLGSYPVSPIYDE